jgi:hypothetical protein
MNAAIPPVPQYAFMEWCLVKTQGKLEGKVSLGKPNVRG